MEDLIVAKTSMYRNQDDPIESGIDSSSGAIENPLQLFPAENLTMPLPSYLEKANLEGKFREQSDRDRMIQNCFEDPQISIDCLISDPLTTSGQNVGV